jgi:type IV secretory pathway TraG/TraD family ATPase VirD4
MLQSPMAMLIRLVEMALIIVGYPALLILGWLGKVGKLVWGWLRRSKRTTHGDAEFADKKTLKKNGNLTPGGFSVGYYVSRWKKHVVYAHREASVIMLGQRGAGKSMTIRHALELENGADVVVVDPKGEHYEATAQGFRDKGYGIILVDCTAATSTGYDPLSFFQHSVARSLDIDTFVQLAIQDTDNQTSAGQHFLDLSRNTLGAAISVEVFNWKSGKSLSDICINIAGLWKEQRDKYLKDVHKDGDPITKSSMNALFEAADREKGSIFTTISRKYRPWMDSTVRNIVMPAQSWCWEDVILNQQRYAVFIITGHGDSSVMNKHFARLMVGLAVASVQRLYNKTRQGCVKGLRIYADEAALLGECTPLVSVITQLRSANVNAFMAFQSQGQIRDLYGKENGNTLMSNCDWIITGGMKDIGIYKEVEALAGDRTILAKSESSGKFGKSGSEHEAPLRILKADQIFRLPYNETICLLGNTVARLEKTFKRQ